MASIGGVACNYVKGFARSLKWRLDVWQVPGLNGYGAQNLGTGESEFSFTATYYGTAAAVNVFIAAIEALQGSTVTIVDDWGITYTYMMVTRVGPAARRTAVIPGTTTTTRVDIEVSGVKIT